MDRKELVILMVCLGLVFAWSPIVNKLYPPRPMTPEEIALDAEQKSAQHPSPSSSSSSPSASTLREIGPSTPAAETSGPDPDYLAAPSASTLETDLTTYDITDQQGGGIRRITLKAHHGLGESRVTNNDKGHNPLLQIRGISPSKETAPATVRREGTTVSFSNDLGGGLTLNRTFSSTGDYTGAISFAFSNKSAAPLEVPRFLVNCGTGAPIHEIDMPLYIGADIYDGSKSIHKKLTDFDKSGFLFITFREARRFLEEILPADWVTSRNQFFVNIVDLKDQPFAGYRLEEVEIPKFQPNQATPPKGVTTWGIVEGFQIQPGATTTLAFDLYSGPREYWRLKKLGGDKDLVMDFGFWGWVSVPLLNLMNFIHKLTQNYGIAIILMVIVIKGVFWPLQSSANKTMKQMQALQPKLKEAQEKYKDDPTRLQTEMMDLYRDYGVNPMGGCFPVLVQIPVFFGFYAMLQTAVELRDASFLWVQDLSLPDTVAHMPFLDFPINPLPLLMGATSVWQMNITPNTSMDKTQATMMKIMPLFFVFICYNFSSALALYWTVQNLIGVAQMYHNLAVPSPKLEKVKQRPKTRWAALVDAARQQADQERQSRKKKR